MAIEYLVEMGLVYQPEVWKDKKVKQGVTKTTNQKKTAITKYHFDRTFPLKILSSCKKSVNKFAEINHKEIGLRSKIFRYTPILRLTTCSYSSGVGNLFAYEGHNHKQQGLSGPP